MNFESVLVHIKAGECCARQGWNGKGMWVRLIPQDSWAVSSDKVPSFKALAPWIGLRTADGNFVPWLASQTDILADDWGLAGPSLMPSSTIIGVQGIDSQKVMGNE